MSEKQLRKNSVNRVCNERILSAYPAHKQMNLMRAGGHDLNCMDAWINAQRDACKVHELAIESLDEESLELRDYDIHAGWPDDVDVEDEESSAEAVLDELESVKDAIDSHPRHVEPPAAIADLIDPSLTPKQNLDALMAKYRTAKNLEEYARSGGDMSAAMKHLNDADRFESGIKWNRAVLAEMI